ncbi:MAG: putative metal-binding motif-containing protein [Myxococcota bacterium]
MLLALVACSDPPPRDDDGDGHVVPMDCADDDPAIHPDAGETCANGVDDDCDGIAAGCGPAGWMDVRDAPARVLADPEAGYLFGAALAGDADGDGVADLALRASDGRASTVWVVSAALEGDLPLRATDPVFTDETDGFELAAGDLDGDGLADLVLPSWDPGTGTGGAYLLRSPLGADLGAGDADAVLVALGAFRAARAALPGDVDGDGLADVVLADPDASRDSPWGGAVWVVPGDVSGTRDLDDAGVRLDGGYARQAGLALTGGDLDGDGLAEVVVGTRGDVRVVTAPLVAGRLADASDRIGGDPSLGEAVALGDGDGDGHADLLLGAAFAGWDGDTNRGAAWLLAGPFVGDRTVDDAVATVEGAPGTWAAGFVVALPGDLDGDDRGEIALECDVGLGARGVALFRGGLAGTWDTRDAFAFLTGEPGDALGAKIVGTGDPDGDGWGDLFLLAPLAQEDGVIGAGWRVPGGPGL